MEKLKPNAETFRIRALAHLATKDLSQARLEIRKALELEPRWETIRLTAAVIDYFSALSPAALPERLVPWPEPVDWAFVKRDDESLECLRRAAEVFGELSERPEQESTERRILQAWRLACLANDPERQEQAIEYCEATLRADPADDRAITWAIARHFDIDLKPSEDVLATLVAEGKAEISHILALLGCHFASGRAKETIELLQDTRVIFQEHEEDVLWTFWYIQSLLIGGDPKAAVTAINSSQSKGKLRHAQTMVFQALAKETGEWQQLIGHLQSSYEETGDPKFLFQCCELKIQQEDWSYVADRAEQLVAELGTGDALRMATIAAYNAKRFDLCLGLLDDHRELFRQGRLPSELRRIRTFCLHALGVLPEAIVEAEALAREEPTSEHLLDLAQLYFGKGDIKSLAIVARQLNGRPDLTAEQALRIAQLVQWEDRELAISLWRRAERQGVPDNAVGAALDLGFQLGLDKELRSLTARMENLGRQGRGGIQVATIEEAVTFVQQRREEGAKLDEAYQNGTAPIHVIAERLNCSLAHLYHRLLGENEVTSDPIRQSCLLVRHGGRWLVSGFPDSAPGWHLNLDVTAVLLAAHLEILAEIERTFKPLRIPADLIPALVRMRDMSTHHQPSRLQACRQIVDLAEMHSLGVVKCDLPPNYTNVQLVEELGKEWVALFEKARASGGYLVDFLPVTKRDRSGPSSALPEGAGHYLVNCRSVVEALWQQGPLSEEKYNNVLRELGDEGRKAVSEAVPEEGSPLYWHASIPEVLADAGLLQIVCERFQVCIEQRELDRMRGELKEHERRCEVAEWLEGVISGLGKGIDDGTYEIIPLPPEEGGTSKETSPQNSGIRCLLALLSFEAREGDVIWVDDRRVNSYLRRDGVPIIGINEVLKSLVSAGALGVSDYYGRISRLRAANVRFIPIQTEEILYHLEQARIKNGTVLETQGLIVLRRYIAACLLQGSILQTPRMSEESPNKEGEIAFLHSLNRAMIHALAELWASENDESICRARAEWLLANLYLEDLGVFNVGSPRSEQDDRYLAAVSLAGLIGQAITLQASHRDGRPSARQKYFDWLFNRVLRKRFDADPHLVAVVSEVLKKILRSTREETLKKNPKLEEVISLLQAFHEDLPEPIQDELRSDIDFMASIGLKSLIMASVNGLNFDREEFLPAAGKAINGSKATITPIGSDTEVIFQPLEDDRGRGAFSINDPVSGSTKHVRNDILGLLLKSPTQRETILRRNRRWFDCLNETFEQAVAEIASIEDPQRRVDQAKMWRDSSAAVYYANLHRKLREQEQFRFADLRPPSAEGLLRHFRLAPDVSAFQETLARAVQVLIREEGLEVAMSRLVGFPVPLPAALLEDIAELSPKDSRALIKRWLRAAGSPLSKIHLLHVLIRFGDEASAYRRLARRIIVSLLSTEGEEEFEVFLAILKWVNDEFGHWPDAHIWPPHIRLGMVWAHAHRLFTIFSSAGVPVPWLRQTFSQASQRISPETFERDPDYWFDVAHPRRVSRVAFLLSCLSYSLGKESMGFVDKELRDMFAREAFTEMEGQRVPSLQLVRDSAQAPNALDSFLGGDRGETLSPLLGDEDGGVFARSSLKALVAQAVDKLTAGSDEFSAWAYLHAVLGDLPPYEGLADPLKTIIRGTDFACLFEKSEDLGNLAILTASLQVINLADECLRRRFRDQLIEIARLFAGRRSSGMSRGTVNEDDFAETAKVPLHLLELALNVSVAAPQSKHVVAEFADLLTQLVETWHSMIPPCKPMVQRLCEELPISQAQKLWPLLVRLRAE